MKSDQIQQLSIEDYPKIPYVIKGVSPRFLRQNKVLPIDLRDSVLSIIIADPDDSETIEALRVATGADIQIYTGSSVDIDEYLSKSYEQGPSDMTKIIEDINVQTTGFAGEEEENVSQLKGLASEAPIIKLVNLIISRALENRTSDIHMEPYEDELKVRYRIDGVLHDIESAPGKLRAAIVSRVKIMANLNIAERRLPQDGRIKLRVKNREIDIRVSTIPVLFGESVVMRILDKESIVINLDILGFPQGIISEFKELIQKPHGIILSTGPTGSGKTTTLYAALDKINSPEKKIVTVEDPVEYQLKGINQIHVKPQIGLNFANILRHIVRHDPDIIMVGEIRDIETAEIAIQSALTGHLIFSTLHTNDAPGAITRLLDMGVENFLLSSTLRGVLAQRLVRVICPHCKEIDHSSTDIEKLHLLGIKNVTTVYKGMGCEKCSNTGYYGRTGIFELLTVDEEIKHLILNNAASNRIRAVAKEHGMKTLMEDGIDKVIEGITNLSELFRVTQEI